MDIREKCVDIVRNIPDAQLFFVAEILENARKMIDEMNDDAYCQKLYEHAKFDSENTGGVSIEQLAGELGVSLL